MIKNSFLMYVKKFVLKVPDVPRLLCDFDSSIYIIVLKQIIIRYGGYFLNKFSFIFISLSINFIFRILYVRIIKLNFYNFIMYKHKVIFEINFIRKDSKIYLFIHLWLLLILIWNKNEVITVVYKKLLSYLLIFHEIM